MYTAAAQAAARRILIPLLQKRAIIAPGRFDRS
jgi:hypothetical protein